MKPVNGQEQAQNVHRKNPTKTSPNAAEQATTGQAGNGSLNKSVGDQVDLQYGQQSILPPPPTETQLRIPPGLAKKASESLPGGNPWKPILEKQEAQETPDTLAQAPEMSDQQRKMELLGQSLTFMNNMLIAFMQANDKNATATPGYDSPQPQPDNPFRQ